RLSRPSRKPIVGRRRRPALEALEDRCQPSAIGVFDPSGGWFLRNTATPGAPDTAPFAYGGAGWNALAADWTGQGHTGLAAFDPSTATWYVRNSSTPGAPDVAPFAYGGASWTPLVGD